MEVTWAAVIVHHQLQSNTIADLISYAPLIYRLAKFKIAKTVDSVLTSPPGTL